MDKAKIQAEIAAKKERLAALKAKRDARAKNKRAPRGGATSKEERAKRLEERRKQREARKAGTGTTPAAKPKAADTASVLASMTDVVGEIADPSKEAEKKLATLVTTTPDNTNINIDSVVPEQIEKEVECTIIGGADDDQKQRELQQQLNTQRLQLMEDEEKMKRFKEQLKRDKLRYDKLREQEKLFEPQELTGIEIRRIENSKDFQGFFTNASKCVERALNFSYDDSMLYVSGGGDNGEEAKEEKLKPRTKLHDESKTGSRAVTSIAWSSKFKELLLSSYDGQDDQMSLDPDGTVLIWNMHMPNRPEYSFYCNSAVLTADFHPSNPKLIVGGCRSGQVVIWDTRQKETPVFRTSLSKGHTYPVYALCCLPAVNNNNLISVSTDGLLCQWNDTNLSQPGNRIDLNKTLKESDSKDANISDEITTTSMDFPGSDTSSVLLGSDEGKVYKARIYDQKGIWYTIDAHDAPITNINFHPTQKNSPTNVSDLFLTASYDWTVKLWSNKTNRALYTFESARDYVFDVQWSTVHPAVFASGDGSGKLDIWHLNVKDDIPYYTTQVEKDKGAISRLKWSEDGTHLAVGMSTGGVHVYDVDEELCTASSEQSNVFYAKMKSETINV